MRRPKDGDAVICGGKGMPGCGVPGKIDDLDRLVLRNSDEVRDATLASRPQKEYGMVFKQTRSHFYDVAEDPDGNMLQTSGKNGKVDLKYSLERGEKVVATLHSHPSCVGCENFSGYDINHTPIGGRSYLVTADNAVLRFDQASNTITVIQSPARLAPPSDSTGLFR